MHQLLPNYRELNNPTYAGTLRYSLAKNKLQAFYVKWLYVHRQLAEELIKKARQGTLKPSDYPNPLFHHHRAPLYSPHPSMSNSGIMNNTITPPRPQHHQSIQHRPSKFSSNTDKMTQSVLISRNRDSLDSQIIPAIFVNGGRPIDSVTQGTYKAAINTIFTADLSNEELKPLMTQIGLPQYFSALLIQKLGKTTKDKVTKAEFLKYWKSQLQNKDFQKRAFILLKKPSKNYIEFQDFKPLLKQILSVHPGLDFLKETPEFQDWYSLCVTNRIMYRADRKQDKKITYRQYKRANITASLRDIEAEPDINKNRDFFSYQDFYVIYIKFWELDSDHDFFLTKQEFSKYSGYAISRKALQRIFSQCARKFQQDRERMNFGDFVWFILSEEDKTTEMSIEYWFKIIDLDNNGIITGYELEHFFQEQSQRLAYLNSQLAINFQNIVCQMVDLLKPEYGVQFTLEHFLRQKAQCGIFFNILTNLNKLVAYQQRDAYAIRSQRDQHPDYTEWERFVKPEYKRIENQADNDDGGEVLGMDTWQAD